MAREREWRKVCGLKAVEALFRQRPATVERLFYEASLAREVGSWCRQLAGARKVYRQVGRAELSKISGTLHHHGVVAVAEPVPLRLLSQDLAVAISNQGEPLLVAENLGNDHNLGAIARTAAFFGWKHLVVAGEEPPTHLSDAAYRVSEGGLDHLALWKVRRLPVFLKAMQPNFRIMGATVDHRAQLLGKSSGETGKRPPLLILGNEETGLDPATAEACSGLVRIPGAGPMESLNVSAAAAVLLWSLTP